MLTSFAMNEWQSVLLLDNVVAFFIVLYVLVLYLAFKRNQPFIFLFSGLIIGIAYLTKQSAIPYFALPLVALVLFAKRVNRRMILGLLLHYGVLLATFGAWHYYVYSLTGSVRLREFFVADYLIDAGKTSGNASFNLINALQRYTANAVAYYNYHIKGNFVLAPAFLTSWVMLSAHGLLRRDRRDLYIAAACLFFLPFIFFLGDRWLLRQSFPLLMLVIVVLARVVVFLIRFVLGFVFRRLGAATWQPAALRLALIGAVIVLAATQVFGEGFRMIVSWIGFRVSPPTQGLTTYGMDYYASQGNATFVTSYWMSPIVTSAGNWMAQNLPQGARVLGDWEWLRAIYFAENGQNPFIFLGSNSSNSPVLTSESEETPKPLFIWPESDTELQAIDETQPLSQLSQNNIDYVLVNMRRNFLTLYFDANPGFKRVFTGDKGQVKIYQVLNPQPLTDFKTHVSTDLAAQLRRAEEDRALAMTWDDQFLQGTLGVSDSSIADMQAGKYPTFDSQAVYK